MKVVEVSGAGLARHDIQRGTTLLEVMVTLLVMSVGLLGIAGLQSVSLQSTTNTNHATHAMMLTHDLMDRMRSNREALLSPAGVVRLNNYGKAADSPFPPAKELAASCFSDIGCSSADMARNDLIQWSSTLKQVLPVTDAQLTANTVICLDSTPDSLACDGLGEAVKIAFSWSESGLLDRQAADPAATVQTYVTSFEP